MMNLRLSAGDYDRTQNELKELVRCGTTWYIISSTSTTFGAWTDAVAR